jgi:hypothetical protein
MQDFLLTNYDINCSATTVYRILERHRWSRKIVTKHAYERSQLARDAFWLRTRTYHPEQVVALDESACNERSGDRKRGWAPLGQPAIAHYSARRSERWSILPAMTINGYIALEIYQGGFNQQRFNDFLQYQVLPQCTPYSGPRSVIILDNASIHHSDEVINMCMAAGVILDYLPPHSPDFNPIEQSFKVLKDWLKRNSHVAGSYNSFKDFLLYGISQTCIDRDCRGMFYKCSYVVDDY